jgi:hypothetical protein
MINPAAAHRCFDPEDQGVRLTTNGFHLIQKLASNVNSAGTLSMQPELSEDVLLES